jgi:hypothetical protein
MVLNWNIEVILDFIISILLLVTTIISYTFPKTKRITSLFYLRLGFFCIGLYMLFDGLAILFISGLFSRLSCVILFPVCNFLIIGINYTLKEKYYSFGLLVVFSLGILLIYFAFQPDSTYITNYLGYPRIEWNGLFNILGIIFTGICSMYLFFWGVKTFKNAPFLLRKDALLFFLGIFIGNILGILFYLLYFIEGVFILFSNSAMIIGLIIINLAFLREPKLLFILPFKIYRIVVKDKNGHPLYDHDWSETEISETIFTGFLNAVQLMSEEVMHIGGLLDINLEDGILILKESENITVGLVASKSSKLLRDSVINFTNDFETKFKRELKSSVTKMSQYDAAFELIEKYFSNFPYSIIKSKKQCLLLTGKHAKIPLELENKLRQIFPDEDEFEAIKTELLKTPLSFSSEFTKFVEEMRDENEELSDEEMKYLDDN